MKVKEAQYLLTTITTDQIPKHCYRYTKKGKKKIIGMKLNISQLYESNFGLRLSLD